MATKTSRTQLGDLVVADFDPSYNYETRTIPADASEQALEAGTPYGLVGEVMTIPETVEADIDGLLCESVTVPAGETMRVLGIERGPATINSDKIVYGAMTAATVNARLAALGFVLRDDPSET